MESLARDKRILLNIKQSSLLRLASIGINLLLVPVLLDFLGEYQYGVWLTISSFLAWSALLDLGMGNGLKNRLSEALARGEDEEIKHYTSSAYAILMAIAAAAGLIALIAFWTLDWRVLLGAEELSAGILPWALSIFFIFFCMKIVLNQILNIAASKQRTSMSDLVNFSINASILLLVWGLARLGTEALIAVVIVYSLIPCAVLLAVSVWAFMGPYKDFRPSLKSVQWSKARDIMNLGSQFFIIQIAGIIIFSTDNLIISHFMDPSVVTPYQISFKYFSIGMIFFSIICTPIWPAYSEAFQRDDYTWIRRTTKRLVKLWSLLVLAVICMYLLAPMIYGIWIGQDLIMPRVLDLTMAAYIIILTWGTIFVTFINSTGYLRIQLIASVIAGAVNIPLSIYFIKHTQMGAAGVMLATIICLSYGPLISVIQYHKILSGARGIWVK